MPDPRPEVWTLRRGANLIGPNVTQFRVWAPKARHVEVRIAGDRDERHSLQPHGDGEYTLAVPGVGAGRDYFYILDGQRERPDPVSRFQPHGVHGPSRTVNPDAFAWTGGAWQGMPLESYVSYELHTGTFTPEGTFDAAIARLPYLKQLGITAVELMPVAEFPGARNWGYDGVALYAPHSAYGGPDGLKRLVDACHRQGLAVVLDVVYNHLGPEGNYLGEFGPYFTSRYRTPWGEAINFDGPDSDPVRRHFIENALYWLTEYHIDALRLDAIHGIFDFSAKHFLEDLGERFHAQAAALGRRAWLIAESDLNDARVIRPREQGGYAMDAQWHDDFHHALHTVLAGPREGYLADFGAMADLEKSITTGFVYDGRYSRHRRRRHGNSSADRPGRQFAVCIQNHDQVANACRGLRLSRLVSFEQEKLAAAMVVCAPFLPLLFQGQEYGETAPFHYFTSHGDPRLAEAVREGRKSEFAAFVSEQEFADPQAESTFAASKLDWRMPQQPPHSALLSLYRKLLELRRAHPSLGNCRKDLTSVEVSEAARWLVMERAGESGDRALLVANFGARGQDVPIESGGRAWDAALWTGDPLFGGPENAPAPPSRPDGLVRLAAHTAALYLSRG